MNFLPVWKNKFREFLDKVPIFAGLSFTTQFSFLVLLVLFVTIPLTVLGARTVSDLRSRAVTYCSVTVSWPANSNRPTNCSQSLPVSWSSPGFAVGLGKGGVWVATSPQISATSYTFTGLSANTTYTYVICSPNCGTGKIIKQGSQTSTSSGTLTVSWYYTVSLTEVGCLSCNVGGSPKTTTGTSITFTGLQPSHSYNYYVCTLDCGTGVLVPSGSGTKTTGVCPITYQVKLTSLGNPSNVVAQIANWSQTSYPFKTSNIQPTTTYDFYVFSPSGSSTLWYQGRATSDNACLTSIDNPPTVAITNPTSGATIFGTVVVSANATDDKGVSRVVFYIDSLLAATDYTSPYSYNFDTTKKSNGTHTIKVIAYDTAGKTAQQTISVTIQNGVTAQGVPTIAYPYSGQTVSNPYNYITRQYDPITLQASNSGRTDISRVEWWRDDKKSLGTSTAGPRYSIPWNTLTAYNGSHSIKAKFFSNVGGLIAEPSVSVTVDNSINNSIAFWLAYYINNERANDRLAKLTGIDLLNLAAKIRSQDMVDQNYFSHTAPNGGTFIDVLNFLGVNWSGGAGETLARNNYSESSSAKQAFDDFMASPDHRGIILNPVYTQFGIGVVQDNSNPSIKYFTVIFVRP